MQRGSAKKIHLIKFRVAVGKLHPHPHSEEVLVTCGRGGGVIMSFNHNLKENFHHNQKSTPNPMVSLGKFPVERTKKLCSIYLPTGIS